MPRSSLSLWTAQTLLLAVLAALAAQAQPPTRLTLQKALEMAEQGNLNLVAARLRRAQTLARIQIARQRPNPAVTFESSRDAPHQSLFLEQPLELGFKRQYRIEVARREGELTDLEISVLAREVRRNTREAYYGVARARAEAEFEARVQKLAERLRQIAQERYQAGAVAQLEVLRAEAGVSSAQAEFEVAQQRQRVSLSQLNALLNQPVSQVWELAGSLEDPLPGLTMEEVLQKAYARNPELQRLAQEQRVEQSRLSLFKAERLPDLTVGFGAVLNSPPEFQTGARGQLSLVLPLFSRNQGEIAESRATQRVLESQALAARRTVTGSVERAYFELEALQTQVKIYREKLLPTAHRLEGLAEESYRAGKTDILFVLDAQRNVQEVERNYLASLFALQGAFGALEESAGGPLDK